MNKYIIEIFCDNTIIMIVTKSKLNETELENELVKIFDCFDDVKIYDYSNEIYTEIVNHYNSGYNGEFEIYNHVKISNFELIVWG